MFLKLLIGKCLITPVSVHAQQQGLADIDKNKFYELLICSVSKPGENEIVILGGDLNGHVEGVSNGYEKVHSDFGYGPENQAERILELGAALNM